MRVASFVGGLACMGAVGLALFVFFFDYLSLAFLLMLVISTILVYAIKWVFPTKRPDNRPLPSKKNMAWYLWKKVDQSAFPSAHTARAMGLVTIALLFHQWWLLLGSIFFLVLIAVARVLLKRHYRRDIAGGLIVGFISGGLAMAVLPGVARLFLLFF